jgi:hypothetical protein
MSMTIRCSSFVLLQQRRVLSGLLFVNDGALLCSTIAGGFVVVWPGSAGGNNLLPEARWMDAEVVDAGETAVPEAVRSPRPSSRVV